MAASGNDTSDVNRRTRSASEESSQERSFVNEANAFSTSERTQQIVIGSSLLICCARPAWVLMRREFDLAEVPDTAPATASVMSPASFWSGQDGQ
jgi:hypothetical protein